MQTIEMAGSELRLDPADPAEVRFANYSLLRARREQEDMPPAQGALLAGRACQGEASSLPAPAGLSAPSRPAHPKQVC